MGTVKDDQVMVQHGWSLRVPIYSESNHGKCLGYDTVPKRTVAIYLFRSFPATAAGPGWLARAVLLYCS